MDEMELTFVNVGYGEAVLVRCPTAGGDFVLVIDGGSGEAEEYDAPTGRTPLLEELLRLGVDHIDLMVITHIHEDHVCGLLPAARAMPPKAVWQSLPVELYRTLRVPSPQEGDSPSRAKFSRSVSDYQALCAAADARGALRRVAAGDGEELCPGLTVRVLAPQAARMDDLAGMFRRGCAQPDPVWRTELDKLDAAMNNFSLILMLDWRGTRVLLPGDTNRNGFAGVEDPLNAHIFKVGHHGQIDGADAALLRRVAPDAVVCCASSDRRYHSAHPDVLSLIRDSGAKLYFSDCPTTPWGAAPPHRAVTFTLGADGAYTAAYQGLS